MRCACYGPHTLQSKAPADYADPFANQEACMDVHKDSLLISLRASRLQSQAFGYVSLLPCPSVRHFTHVFFPGMALYHAVP